MTPSGYEHIEGRRATLFIRPAWKPLLLRDLEEDFQRVSSERRTAVHGRVPHFSYLPWGAPHRVIVRRAVRGGLAMFLGDLHLSRRRALTEIAVTSEARRLGINAPEVLAVRIARVFGPLCRFTLVMSEIPNALNLVQWLEGAPPHSRRRELSEVAREIRRLHDSGIYHGDLHLKNILLAEGRVFFVDLDKAVRAPHRNGSLAGKNLARLYRSSEKWAQSLLPLSRTDRLRFLRSYLGGSDRLKETARRCTSGVWAHRIWWQVTGK